MYIKRKVFSTYIDEYGEERLFSSSEYVDEGDYLDEMMYSDDDHLARNIALGTAGAGAAGIAGAKLVGKKMVKDNKATIDPRTWKRLFNKKNRKKVKLGRKLQEPADFIVENTKKGGKKLGKFAKTSKGKAALVAVPATALAGYGIYKATED